MTKGRFDSFVILAGMRTGSNLLEATLNSVAGITCHGEAFNPHFVGYPNQNALMGMTLGDREVDPGRLLGLIRSAPGLNGFRYFHDHDPRVLDVVLADPRCAKIVLTRNPVDSYVSLLIARQTGQWKLGDARHRRAETVTFDAEGFAAHQSATSAFHARVRAALQRSGQTAFAVDYAELSEPEVLAGLVRFLGAEPGDLQPSRDLVKQNPDALEDKVANYADLVAAVRQLDRFGLQSVADFEPQRGAVVPGHVAAAGAPLLFMPVRSGPVAGVTDWLSGLSTGGQAPGLTRDFTQKSLRKWMRENPAHRSFTVLRDPLKRAHAAFCEMILPDTHPDLRAILRKTYKLPLPAPGAGFADGKEGHRRAFLAFLRFLKANMNGQTSVRVDPAWASQSAVLTGFAQFALPDVVARENSLAADLVPVCAALGIGAPDLADSPPSHDGVSLDDIRDAEIEKAARDAYHKDYVIFGFSG